MSLRGRGRATAVAVGNMRGFWTTVFFWITFGAIAALIFRYFYFSKTTTLARRLRLVAGVLICAVFVLLFFPWLPEAHGGPAGWGVVLQGDVPMVLLAGLLGLALASLFTSRRPFFSKLGFMAHFIASVFLLGLMIYTFPRTVTLEFRDTAPIFAVLILFINNVVLLLLWNQLQKRPPQNGVFSLNGAPPPLQRTQSVRFRGRLPRRAKIHPFFRDIKNKLLNKFL